MKKTVTDLLKYLRVPVYSDYCEQLIASHPDYPSLLSIVDTLNRLGVPNIAARIDKEKLVDLPFPYLLQLTRRSDLLTIRRASDLTKHKDKLDDWDGIVLHIEPTTQINDIENNRLYKRGRTISFLGYAAALVLMIPFLWVAATNSSLLVAGVCVTALAGLAVGYFLVAKDIGVKYEVVENFCTPAGKKNDCEEILSSGGASIFGLIKLSDLVFSYFLCQMFCIASLAVLPAWSTALIQTLSAISLLSIPVVIYSIAYQFRISTWCKLCLIVDGVLLLQTVLFYIEAGGLPVYSFSPSVVAAISGGSLVVFTAVIVIKGQLEDILDLRRSSSENARVKNSHIVFGQLLARTEREVTYKSSQRIISGNKNAPLKFVMAGNLYCSPCGTQHEKIERLVDMYPDLVSVEYRFVTAKDKRDVFNSNQYLFEVWLRDIRNRENEAELTRKLLTDWYELFDLSKFREKYPLTDEAPSKECVALENEQLDWITRQKILRTPTIFLNGTQLPREYQPLDLIVMIPSLAAGERASQAVNSGLKNLV
jgi:Vitamin K epoxide reductase family